MIIPSIPYQGSKSTIAKDIVEKIIEQNPQAVFFYDLFGGGGAISICALLKKRFSQIFYNELDTGIFNLMSFLKSDLIPKQWERLISKEEFTDIVKTNKTDVRSVFYSICMSFSNNRKAYIQYNQKEYMRTYLSRLSRLSFLLKRHINIEFSNKSYEDVKIVTPVENTILYCDIPYKSTAGYKCSFDHEKFYKWARESKYKIYISEYSMPDDFILVGKLQKRQNMRGGKAPVSYIDEKLFCNRA
jgi:DNA adenine methylase